MTLNVLGRRADLSDGRIVFLGYDHAGAPDDCFIAFRNKEGADTYLKISTAALDALVALATDPPDSSTPIVDFPHKTVWRVVRDGETSEVNS